MTGTLYVLYGLPGSGKSHWIKHHMAGVDIRVTQIAETNHLTSAIAYVEPTLRAGQSVALESWGWKYPTDKRYQVVESYFEKNVKQCIRNVINDAIRKDKRCSGIRMNALMQQAYSYYPTGLTIPIHKTRFATPMIDEFFRRFPSRYETDIRRMVA